MAQNVQQSVGNANGELLTIECPYGTRFPLQSCVWSFRRKTFAGSKEIASARGFHRSALCLYSLLPRNFDFSFLYLHL